MVKKKKKEMSEIKGVSILKEYFGKIYSLFEKSLHDLTQLLVRIFKMIEKNGLKSHRKEKKTVFDILIVFNENSQGNKKAA